MDMRLWCANKGRWAGCTNRPPRDHLLGTPRKKGSRGNGGPGHLISAVDKGLPELKVRLQERVPKPCGAFTLQD